ncbi:MAG: FliO/MopB family protein [Armatimonadota bacterium]
MKNTRGIGLVLLVVSAVLVVSMPVDAIEKGASPDVATESFAEGGTPVQVNMDEEPSGHPAIEPVSATAEIAIGETPQSGLSVSDGEADVTTEGEATPARNAESTRHLVYRRTAKKLSQRQDLGKVNPRPAVVDISENATSEGSAIRRVERRPDKIQLLAKHQAAEEKKSSDRPVAPATILSSIFKLGLVLALAYVTILALKWVSDRRQIPLRAGRDIRPMETIRLTPSTTLHVVSIRGKNLLIGCSGNNMSLVCELEKDESLEGKGTEQDRFAEYLARYSGERHENGPAVRIGGLLKDCAIYLRDRVHSRGTCHVEHREE